MIKSIVNDSRDLVNAIYNIEKEINDIDVSIARMRAAKAMKKLKEDLNMKTKTTEVTSDMPRKGHTKPT